MIIRAKQIGRSITGISLDARGRIGQRFEAMDKSEETQKLSWPWWAPWALLAVAATSVLTVAATLYDIL
jgi:hypothetical protein